MLKTFISISQVRIYPFSLSLITDEWFKKVNLKFLFEIVYQLLHFMNIVELQLFLYQAVKSSLRIIDSFFFL